MHNSFFFPINRMSKKKSLADSPIMWVKWTNIQDTNSISLNRVYERTVNEKAPRDTQGMFSK